MSHPALAVTTSTALPDALHAMVALGLRHLAVVDGDGHCVGLLTDRTVAAEWAGRPQAYPHRAVGAACEDPQPVVEREATVATAAQAMHRCGTDAVVVVDHDHRPVGILTAGDLVALLAKPDRATEPGGSS